MSYPDDDKWLRDLEQRATDLERELLDWRQHWLEDPSTDDRDHPSEPSRQEVWHFVHRDLIPQIDTALAAYRSGDSLQEMFTWQVGPQAVNVSIIANANGVLIDISIPWCVRKLYNHYTHLGYKVEPQNHKDDATMQEPTEVRISR